MKKCLFLIIGFLSTLSVSGQGLLGDKVNENVVAQMNYCINSLTNIIHNQSMSVLEHETDQLVNNLTMEQIIGLHEINEFRTDLIDAVGRFGITAEERNLIKRIQSIKRDNMKWAALSNALDPTMLLTGNKIGPQIAFQALLTAARSVIEYKTMQGEQDIEELQAMWDLRKEDLQNIIELRKSAQSIIFELYNRFKLKEYDRLTESSATLFNEYITEADPAKRVRILEDNYKIYNRIPEYYYHLGMAYVDSNNYQKAKQAFLVYLNMYNSAPILRYDERSGCIALTRLTYEKELSEHEKEELISTAINNLPSNSAAVLQCAMVYIYELKNYEKGINLIRSGIDDPKASDRDVLFLAAAKLIPNFNRKSLDYNTLCDIFNKSQHIDLDSYLTFQINTHTDAWEYINRALLFSDYFKGSWYTFGLGGKFTESFQLIIPENNTFNLNGTYVYLENHFSEKLVIKQLSSKIINSISEDEINDVDCFKANRKLRYLFVETIVPGVYKLKDNIDLDKIKNNSYPRLSEFSSLLKDSDYEDIIDFCKDFRSHDKRIHIKYKVSKDANETIFTRAYKSSIYYQSYEWIKSAIEKYKLKDVTFVGDTLTFQPHHSKKQEGYYVRIVLPSGLQIMYKYNGNVHKLEPYLYSTSSVIKYANSAVEAEYLSKEKEEIEERSSWFSNIWNSIFSSKKEKEEGKKQEEESKNIDNEPSWFTKLWEALFSFSDDNTLENQEERGKQKNEERSSWFSKLWGSLFSFADDKVEQQEKEEKAIQSDGVDDQEEEHFFVRLWNSLKNISNVN